MELIQPYARLMDVHNEGDGVRLLKKIEWAARISHRSEETQSEVSYERFLRAVVIGKGDWSVVEHAHASVDATVDRGVTHEWVRHRIGAYTQECLAGETRLLNNLTIQQAYERNLIGCTIRSSNGSEIVRNQIRHIFFKGVQPVYNVTTKTGYRIRATANHEFQCADKQFRRLREITSGDQVMVNGRPSLLQLSDEQLREQFFIDGRTPADIARINQTPYASVTRRLRAIGITQDRRNDHDIEKYNRFHTSSSYQKMAEAIRAGYRNGRIPWNKGLHVENDESVREMVANLHAHQYKNRPGADNSNWKGGVRETQHGRAQDLKRHVRHCEIDPAHSRRRLHVHHIDGDSLNDVSENLVKVCRDCHIRLHQAYRVGIQPVADTVVSIRPCGLTSTFDLEMATHHNYVANGFVVHNSTRFVNYEKKMPPKFIVPPGLTAPQVHAWEEGIAHCEEAYKAMMTLDCTPQIARSVLPNALASRIVVTYNLRNWRHFLLMRTTRETHPQFREVTIPLLAEFKAKIPLLYDDIEPMATQADNVRKAR